MLAVLSPAKTLDFDSPVPVRTATTPEFLDRSQKLAHVLGKKSVKQLIDLMDISPKLAEENHARWQSWLPEHTLDTARQAVFAFQGDVYQGLDVSTWDKRDLNFAQRHLRILSGLYGILRPLDLMQPYRLEMGTRLKVGRQADLYAFWGSQLTEHLAEELRRQRPAVLVNLASKEYFSVLQPEHLDARIITPSFRDLRRGRYRVLSFFAKKARGQMARFLIQQRVKDPEQLKEFDEGGYGFHAELSTESDWVFTRDSAE